MPALERRDVLRNLKRKGFQDDKRTRHTVLIHRDDEGQKTGVSTVVSRGTKYKTLHSPFVSTMAAQCRLTTAQFVKLVGCTMSRDEYSQHIAPPEDDET